MLLKQLLLAAGIFLLAASASPAANLCTLVIDASSRQTLIEYGDCITPITPASTFKIALALIGFDSGVLVDRHTPKLVFEAGDPDWGGPAWRQDTDPAHWMTHSVVWYSQRITRALGSEAMSGYVDALDYGNGDFSGDSGLDNGLERAWISSSLKIAPRDQARFMLDLLDRRLPVTSAAVDNTLSIIEAFPAAEGWTFHGKTGSAYPRLADTSFDYNHGWGWFVGWAERDGRHLVFVRLDQDNGSVSGSGGVRARDALIAEWTSLLAQAGKSK